MLVLDSRGGIDPHSVMRGWGLSRPGASFFQPRCRVHRGRAAPSPVRRITPGETHRRSTTGRAGRKCPESVSISIPGVSRVASTEDLLRLPAGAVTVIDAGGLAGQNTLRVLRQAVAAGYNRLPGGSPMQRRSLVQPKQRDALARLEYLVDQQMGGAAVLGAVRLSRESARSRCRRTDVPTSLCQQGIGGHSGFMPTPARGRGLCVDRGD